MAVQPAQPKKRTARPFRSRKAPTDYHALARQRGFRWLGPEVLRVNTKTGWACSKGHRWQTAYQTIRIGGGCPFCSGKARKVPGDYCALAQARGFRWRGPEVPNVFTKTGWVCSRGHAWQAPYHGLQQGKGCPVCAHHLRKTPADYEALAKARGFRWLGPEVPNANTKTGWACSKGHRWENCYGNLQQGEGCPICAGTRRKTPADYKALAKARGFRWLGPTVPKVNKITRWACSVGHQWRACYNSLQQGTGCPTCARSSDTPSGRRSSTKRIPSPALRTGSRR